MTREEVRMLVERALKDGPFAMRQLAEEAGVSYAVVRGWAIGRRTPTPDNVRRLADAFERRSDRLRALADELRRAVE